MIAIAWCVYCRSPIPDDADHCPSCGKPLTDGSKVIRCPSCGKYILKNSVRCRFCGADPRAKPPAEEPAAPEQPAPSGETASPEQPTPAEESAVAERPATAEQPAAAEPSAPAQQSAPAETSAPAEKTAATPKPASAATPAAAAKSAPAAKPAGTAAAKSAKAKPRKKRKWSLIPLILVLAAGLFFGGRALFGGKKDAEGETRAEYIASCKAVPYAMVSRDPARYKGDRLSFSGTVTELAAGGTVIFHIEQVNLDAPLGSDDWYASYAPSEDDGHVLQTGDEITVYGECVGAETYLARPGETVTIPSIRVAYYESADLERLRQAQQGTVLAVGETWIIDGLCAVTVTGVSETKDRNPDTKKDPIVVYYVDYTYTNLGYVSESADGVYVALDESILDSAGQLGYSYPNPISNAPRSTPVGETCAARCCVGLEHVGPFRLLVSVYDPVFNAYTARFNIVPE